MSDSFFPIMKDRGWRHYKKNSAHSCTDLPNPEFDELMEDL